MLSLQLVFAFVASLACSLALMPAILRIAQALNLYDLPDSGSFAQVGPLAISSTQSGANASSVHDGAKVFQPPRRVHSRPVPRLGGVAIVLGFFLSLLFSGTPSDLTGVFVSSVVLFLTGLVDDLHPLSAKLRLAIQIGASSLAVWTGGLSLTTLYFVPGWGITVPAVIGFAFSVFVIVGSINAINMIDGLDGLAGGVVLIGILFLSYLHFLNTADLQLLLVLSLPLIGAILGFLKYNTHPASVFMGDGGSNWLGFMAGVFFLVVANGKSLVPDGAGSFKFAALQAPTAVQHIPLVVVILCLAVPIFDTAWVITNRLRDGLSPMTPDKRHFHHGLLKLGLSHSQSVGSVYFVAVVFAVLGILPVAFPSYRLWSLPYAAAGFLLIIMPLVLRLDEGFLLRLRTQRALFSLDPHSGPRLSRVVRLWETSNRYIIYAILLATPIFAGVPPRAVGLVALVVLTVLIASILLPSRKIDFLDSVSIACAATVLLVANNANSIWIIWGGERTNIQFVYNYVFLWLAVSTTLLIFLTFRRQYFIVTPSDFLMLLLPLVLLLVPEPYRSDYRLNVIGLRSLVLFTAIRTMQKRHKGNVYRLKMLSCGALIYVILVSFMGLRVIYN